MKPSITVPLEIKALSEREFEGRGSVFRNVDLGGDIVAPGAFKKSLSNHKRAGSLPQMFWMHDPSRVPGKWTDMRETDDGLHVKGVLADTPLGNEIHTLLKMDAVRGLSIGYQTTDADYDRDGNRIIKQADLWEVSVVSLPMNPLAQVVHVKSQLSAAGEYVPTARELERILRDVGCSKSVARRLTALIRDMDDDGEMPSETPVVPESDPARALREIADQILADVIRQKLCA
jgi:HK97 family phage prohead protease